MNTDKQSAASPDRSTIDLKRSTSGRRPQRNRWLRRLLPWVGALVLVGLLAFGFWPKPAPVEISKASIGSVRASLNEEGKTRIRHRYGISAPVAGQLARIDLKAGDVVKAGETIVARIAPLTPPILDARSRALAEARRDTAAAHLERARSANRYSESELRRTEELAKQKTVSEQEFENVQWRAVSAAKELAAAESSLRQAEAELAEFTGGKAGELHPVELRSPVTGRVLRIWEESSRAVAAGTPLLEVGDPADLEAVIEVLSRDGASIALGAAVELEQWGGSLPLKGRVRFVEPAAFTKISALGVEEQRVNLVVDILTPVGERGNLGDLFRVEGRVILSEVNDALKIPTGALFRDGTHSAVYLNQSGKAVLRRVRTGIHSSTETQILEGLKEGDEVIVYPGDRIQEGDRVEPIQVSAK